MYCCQQSLSTPYSYHLFPQRYGVINLASPSRAGRHLGIYSPRLRGNAIDFCPCPPNWAWIWYHAIVDAAWLFLPFARGGTWGQNIVCDSLFREGSYAEHEFSPTQCCWFSNKPTGQAHPSRVQLSARCLPPLLFALGRSTQHFAAVLVPLGGLNPACF